MTEPFAIKVVQDESVQAGHVLLRVSGVERAPLDETFVIHRVDDAPSSFESDWPSGPRRPEASQWHEDTRVLELLVGPDVVNPIPGGVPVRIRMPGLDNREAVLTWPDGLLLATARNPRRGQNRKEVAVPVAARAAAPHRPAIDQEYRRPEDAELRQREETERQRLAIERQHQERQHLEQERQQREQVARKRAAEATERRKPSNLLVGAVIALATLILIAGTLNGWVRSGSNTTAPTTSPGKDQVAPPAADAVPPPTPPAPARKACRDPQSDYGDALNIYFKSKTEAARLLRCVIDRSEDELADKAQKLLDDLHPSDGD